MILGVVSAAEERPRVVYLSTPVPLTDEIAATLNGVSAGEVLRVAAPCQENECPHFRDSNCTLITKIVLAVPEPATGTALPRCYLRARCRWWKQEKAAACSRCPLIVTENPDVTDLQHWIADTQTSAGEFDPRDFPGQHAGCA
jgi:hypothetical protein